MSRLRLLILLFLPIFSCFDVVNIAFTPERDCKESSSLVNNTWSASIGPNGWNDKWPYREAAFISPIHLLTTRQAVMWNKNGEEVMRDLREMLVTQWADEPFWSPVKHVLVPVDIDEKTNQKSFGDLAIVQIRDPIKKSEAFSPICPPDSSDVDPELNVHAFFVEGPAVQKRLIPYSYSKGAKYITTNDERTKEFITAVLTDDFDRIIGLTLNETTAVNVRYWEEFICEHTGICMKGHRMQNWQRNVASHYMENDNIYPVSPCSHSSYVKLMQESTQFTRLNEEEARVLRNTCGRPVSNDDFSFIVTISAENESCNEGECTVESANCTGSLISPRHVITSADCIKSLNEYARIWGTTVYFTDGKELIPNESGHSIPRFSLSARSKVQTVVLAPVDESEPLPAIPSITHNIALLELEEPIPVDSYTKPICLSHSTDPVPDELTVKYFTEATHVNREIRYRQTREIFDEKNNKSSKVQWDYELIRGMTVPPSHYCKDCQYQELSYPSDISFGSPVVSLVNGRWNLIAVSTSLNGHYNKAMRPSYFATFICIHTGICEEGETFTERTLMPVSIADSAVPPSLIRREMTESRKEAVNKTWWHAVIQSHGRMKTNILLLNRLSAEEYDRTRDECGKTIKNFPFVVAFGQIGQGQPEYPATKNMLHGHGVLISRRHILTSRSDVESAEGLFKAHPNTAHVFFGVQDNDTYSRDRRKIDWYEEAEIRLFLIPDQNKPAQKGNFEMAILELERDIVPGLHHQILCLPDYKEWMEERATDGESMLVHSWDTGNEFDAYSLSDDKIWKMRNEIGTGQNVYTPAKDHPGYYQYARPPKYPDSPFIRKFRKSDRYYLEGFLSKTSKDSFSVLPANLMYRDICRLTGVCPRPDDRRVPNDEHVYFMNEYGTNVKQEILCQPQINY